VRLPLQRRRLLRAAADEFVERGYGAASATSIARRAGMSKATFYAHFANKEDCILALYDRANEVVGEETARGVAENKAAAKHGLGPRFASPHDAYAIVGGITELVSRQVRLAEPEDVNALAPVIDRLIEGVLSRSS
jgi:AcrR family transcriptional regulator